MSSHGSYGRGPVVLAIPTGSRGWNVSAIVALIAIASILLVLKGFLDLVVSRPWGPRSMNDGIAAGQSTDIAHCCPVQDFDETCTEDARV